MFLAKISGNVVSTQKNNYLKSEKLLLVRRIDLSGDFISNKEEIALDHIDSGIGDIGGKRRSCRSTNPWTQKCPC